MRINRVFKGLAFALALACGGVLPAAAQDAAPRTVAVEPWQAAITGQVEAFRTRNATAAFGYAAAAFHTAFPSAEAFFSAIIGSGYAPIMESRSHSFGRFEKQGDKTLYTARVRHWTVEDREAHEKMGFHVGWGICTDQLAALAAAL